MAYTNLIYRSNAKDVDDGFNISGSATVNGALTDASDGSYLLKPNTGFTVVDLSMAMVDPSPTEPQAGRFIYYARPLMRVSSNSYGYFGIALGNQSSKGSYTYKSGASSVVGSIVTVSSASRASTGIVTLTTSANHGLAVGDRIVISGNTIGTVTESSAGFLNGCWQVATVPSTTQITFQHNNLSASTVNATNGTIVGVNLIGAQHYVSPTSSAPWTQSNVTNLYAHIQDATEPPITGGSSRMYELFYEVVTATIPTVAIASIDGDTAAAYVVTTTTRPTIAWTYTQAEGLSQTAYVVKVFASNPTNPETDTALWSETGTSSTAQVTVGTDLTNGSTYYVSIKVGTSGTSGTASANYSSWLTTSFSVTITAPTTPTLGTPSWSAANQRATITATGASFATGSQSWDLQRSDDGGTSWKYVRGAIAGNTTAAGVAPATWTVYDYEPLRNTTTRYRIRSVGTTAAGVTIASAWSSASTLAVSAVTTWVMAAFTSTALSGTVQTDVKVLGDLDLAQEEAIGIFRPQGRSLPLVIHGSLNGEDGTYEILAQTIATRDAILEIVNSQKTVLVVDPFGEQKYVRFVGRGMTQSGPSSAPRFLISANYVEVESGLTAG